GERYGACPTTCMPNRRASGATWAPILPSPTIPIVLPPSAVPSNRLRSHSPRRIAPAAHGIRRACAVSRTRAASEASSRLAPGAGAPSRLPWPRRPRGGSGGRSRQEAAQQRQELFESAAGVIAHVGDADGRLLERSVARADRPAGLFEAADDILGGLARRHV